MPENKCNACYKNDCANNATCHVNTLNPNTFECSCLPGFYGAKCDQTIDACYGQPCKNNAECKILMEGRYKYEYFEIKTSICYMDCFFLLVLFLPRCECQPGWEGYNCEVNTDECKSSPCQNGGICTDKVASFSCQCVTGYTGSLCEKKVAWCSTKESNPCLNEAACVRVDSKYK